MAKETFIAALVAASMSLFLVSCEKSSFVGLEYCSVPEQTDAPKEDTATNVVIVSGEFEKILPPEWGKIEGASISAVPADDEKGGCFDKKCLVIRTKLGAVTVVFPREEVLPEVADIVNYSFIKGNFDETYNSAVFAENSWIPAQAVDSKDRLEYIDGVAKRNLRYTTLKQWDWQNKNENNYFSTKVSGYEINVEDGILKVIYSGEQVLKIR